jgi:hypothetical protein
VPGYQIDDGGRVAAVGDADDIEPQTMLQSFADDLARAVAVPIGELAGVGFGIGHQFDHRGEWRVGVGGKKRRKAADASDRSEVDDRIVGHILEQTWRGGMGGVGCQQQRIAVRSRTCDG